MEYTALYRKFRPLTFEEMVGQEHITRTLKNQIIAERIGHAYLFNGGRGTGKTSAAKILARAVNCLNPKEGEPCNECEICKAILAGSLTDVVEMDAASNNSVEDIRSIREEVNFLPTLAKYRVYIIDEVHMLSTGAFNALLKTLEEPPAHVKFILATTEPQKLPATILSRCQRFDFKRISNQDVIKRLEIVCKESKVKITKEALNIIAVLSEGAMRDALSILERCIQEQKEEIDEEIIRELVGIPKLEHIHKIVQSIVEYNVEEVLQAIEEIIDQGKDINNLIWEMIKYVKDILIYQTTKKVQLYNQQEVEQMEKIISKVTKERLLKIIYELSELENSLKWSTQKSILFQAGIIQLCNPIEQAGIEELRQKIKEIEEKINSGNITIAQKPKNIKPQQIQQSKAEVKVDTSKIQSENYWKDIVDQLRQSGKMVLYTNLINTKAKQVNDLIVEIIFLNGLTTFGKSLLERPENINEIEKLIAIACGKEMKVKFVDAKEHLQRQQEQSIEDKVKDLNLPINIVEE